LRRRRWHAPARPRLREWLPLEDWFDWILGAGFQLRAFHEPRPSEQVLRERPDLEDAAKVPYYVVFDLVRGEA
jgi:hypothetical protein